MSETLFIRLNARSDDSAVEYAVSVPGQPLTARSGSLSEAAAHAGSRRLIGLVPQVEVRLTSVDIAARDPAKVLQATPYALEDQFAEDVDTLHFALGARSSDGRTPVAVVSRQRMDGWMLQFEEQGLRPALLVPEALALAEPEPGRWCGLAEAGGVIVRTAPHGVFTCVPETLDSHLQLAVAPGGTTLTLHVCAGCDHDFTRLPLPIELNPGWPLGLDCLLRTWDAARTINLLQGRYATGLDAGALWKPWRLPAALTALWLIALGASTGLQAWTERKELDRLNETNLRRFQELFPSEVRVVDIAVQAEQQLAQLKQGATPAGVFPLMEATAAGLATEPGLNLQSLQFREGALYLSLSGNDLQSLERLRSWFGQRPGVALDVQSANASSLGVQIRLKLTPA